MIWDAFVWGVGAASGAMVVIVSAGVVWWFIDWITDPNGLGSERSYRQAMLEAAWNRNELAMEANDHLETIAMALTECEDDEDEEYESWRG